MANGAASTADGGLSRIRGLMCEFSHSKPHFINAAGLVVTYDQTTSPAPVTLGHDPRPRLLDKVNRLAKAS